MAIDAPRAPVSVPRLPYFRRSVRFMPPCMRRRRSPTACRSASRRLRGAPSNTRPMRRTDSSSGSLDKKTIVDRTFKTHVLENRYLKVTLRARIRRAHSFHHLQADRPRTALSHRSGRALRNQGRQFLLRLADGVWRHLPDVPGCRARQDVAEAVGFQGGEAECRRSDGVDVAQGRFRVFRGAEAVQRARPASKRLTM